ncbi:MAG: hypothetical protein MI742_04065 [Desulfobacterales bacterium]|nr:hypothetical protein [Desulfobacterales bacterium]
MNILTIAGAPSAGKTAVITHICRLLKEKGEKTAAAKFDALSTTDHLHYQKELGMDAVTGLSDYTCPDHYYVSNLEEVISWGKRIGSDHLFIETAGLCYRCAPHIKGIPALTIIDNLGGLDTPSKMGPMLETADVVALTKVDMVSQAEKEVFIHRIKAVSPKAEIVSVNGLTGTGVARLLRILQTHTQKTEITGSRLRYPMPAAICSYCTGEQRIGQAFQSGNIHKIILPESKEVSHVFPSS